MHNAKPVSGQKNEIRQVRQKYFSASKCHFAPRMFGDIKTLFNYLSYPFFATSSNVAKAYYWRIIVPTKASQALRKHTRPTATSRTCYPLAEMGGRELRENKLDMSCFLTSSVPARCPTRQ